MDRTPPPSFGDDDVYWARLGRLLAGELSAAEEAELLSWILADPAREQLLATARELWAISEPRGPSRDPEAVLEAIRRRDAAQVRELSARPRLEVMSQRPARRPLRRLLAAAAIAGVLAGGWWSVQATRPWGGQPPTAAALQEHRTTRGQRLTLAFPDGSTVMLGPESVLRHDTSRADGARTVELEGEAYFDVAHDEARPFVVRTRHAIARDLGTRFTVRAREGEAEVEVAVAEGIVAVSAARPPSDGAAITDSAAILEAHDVGRVEADGRTTVRRDVPVDRYLSWTEGRLIFEETPLSVVAAELSRWYNVDIRLQGDGLAEKQLTATFDNMSAARVLPMIQASLGLQVRRSGREYVLTTQ